MEPVEGMLVSGLDQDWKLCVEAYDALAVWQRAELASRLVDERKAPATEVDRFVMLLLNTALVETAYRWWQRQELEARESDHDRQ